MNSKLTKKLMLTAALFASFGAASLASADDFEGPSVGTGFAAPETPGGFAPETPGEITTAPRPLAEPTFTPLPDPDLQLIYRDRPETVGNEIPSAKPPMNDYNSGEQGDESIKTSDSLRDTLDKNGAFDDERVDPNLRITRPPEQKPTPEQEAAIKSGIAATDTYIRTGDTNRAAGAAGRTLINTIGRELFRRDF